MKPVLEWLRGFFGWWRAKPDRWMLAVLVVLTLAKGLLWLGTYPLWKIADEPAHFDNIQYRAEHQQRPPQAHGALVAVLSGSASPELRLSWSATQKYHREKHAQFQPVVDEEPQLTLMAKEAKNRSTDGQMPALMYPGVYYGLGTLPYLALAEKSIVNRAYAVRMLSLLFGLLAVLATFFAARYTFDAPELALAAACFAGLQPMFSQQTVAINNDAAVIGMSAVAFALQMKLLKDGAPTLLMGALTGLFAALAVMSKPQGWLLVATSFLVFLWVSRRNWRESRRLWAGAAAAVVAVMLVSALWPTDPAPVVAAVTEAVKAPLVSPAPGVLPAERSALGMLWDELVGFPKWVDALDAEYRLYLFRSAWGQFSWLEFSIGAQWTEAVKNMIPLCVAGLVVALVMRILRAGRLFWGTPQAVLAAFTAVAATVSILFVEYHVRLAGVFAGVIQGRNFLFAIPAFAILVVLGLASLVPRRLHGLTAAMIITASLSLNLAAIVCIVRQHYGG